MSDALFVCIKCLNGWLVSWHICIFAYVCMRTNKSMMNLQSIFALVIENKHKTGGVI